jgi:multiple sugar transport system ATP-binding protein
MTLADRIAIMSGGEIQQFDSPQAIYNRPVSRFVAGFIGSPGMNFLEGALDDQGTPTFRAGDIVVPLSRYGFDNGAAPRDKVVLGIRPEHIFHGAVAASQPFSKEIEIEIVEPMGSDTLVWGKLGSHNLSFRVDSEKPVKVGDRVPIGFDPARASLFDGAGGERL